MHIFIQSLDRPGLRSRVRSILRCCHSAAGEPAEHAAAWAGELAIPPLGWGWCVANMGGPKYDDGDRVEGCGTGFRAMHWLNIEPCGMICASVTWLIVLYCEYAVTVCGVVLWLACGAVQVWLTGGAYCPTLHAVPCTDAVAEHQRLGRVSHAFLQRLRMARTHKSHQRYQGLAAAAYHPLRRPLTQ